MTLRCRRFFGRGGFAVTMLVCAAAISPSYGASPRLSVITPRGVQRGAEHELTFQGSALADAQEIFFYDSGFEVLSLQGDGNTAKARVRVAADCRLGEHVAQVRTASGISDYRTLYVEALPVVEEVEPNSDFATRQEIELNRVINGSISNEDVDYFQIRASKGQRISAEIVAMRLSTAMFDPYVAILDEKRFELASSDDTSLALQDGYVSVVAPADGVYAIEVRESAYSQGDTYRLHVGTFPRPQVVFPAGGKLAETTEVRFLGLPTGELTSTVALPERPVTDFGLFAEDEQGISPTPNVFRLYEHGNAFELEPNNELTEATAAALPLAFNGIIDAEGDVDCFKFSASKGMVYDVECYARRVRSGLDPVMNLYHADGRQLAGNDDSRGPDSYVRLTIPEDGEYIVRIHDHLNRGGPHMVYRVEFQSVAPALTLGIPRTERYGQYRQQVFIARGNRFGTLISATRANFGGELLLLPGALPAGVSANWEPMPANQNLMPVVFEAAADAEVGGALVDFRGKAADPNQLVEGGFINRADYLVADPGQSLYRWKDVDRLAVAVIEEVPFQVEIIEPKVPLVRDGSMNLRVVATKRDGWDEDISVELPYRPPGVSGGPSVSLPKGQTEALYPLNASGDAEIKSWKVFASASSQGMWASTRLSKLDVAEAYVRFELQRAACEQGQEGQVLCKLKHTTPFEGEARAELVGVPPHVSVEPLNFTSQTQELTFVLKTTSESPAGKHGLFCQVTIPQGDESIVSRAGNVEFQIDVPLPAATPAPATEAAGEPAAAAAVTSEAAPPAKPLSRLQKLRLAAEQRQAERNMP